MIILLIIFKKMLMNNLYESLIYLTWYINILWKINLIWIFDIFETKVSIIAYFVLILLFKQSIN